MYGQWRVPGLRRSEVAMLAGVSVEYYTRLERGNLGGASDSVLDALAQALRLDDTEREHLYALSRAGNAGRTRVQRRGKKAAVRPSVLRIIEGLNDQPAYVRNYRMDILAANPLAPALRGVRAGAGQHLPVRLPRSAGHPALPRVGTRGPRRSGSAAR